MSRPLTLSAMRQRAALVEDMLHRIEVEPDYPPDVHLMGECIIWDVVSKQLHVWCYRNVRDGEPPAPIHCSCVSGALRSSYSWCHRTVCGQDGAELLSGAQGINPAWRDTLGMHVKMLERVGSTYFMSQRNTVQATAG